MTSTAAIIIVSALTGTAVCGLLHCTLQNQDANSHYSSQVACDDEIEFSASGGKPVGGKLLLKLFLREVN